MVRKLAIRSLRRGIGSMDYIDSLLIMEDDLDENQEDDDLGEFGESSIAGDGSDGPPEQDSSREIVQESLSKSAPNWCVCGRCRPMSQEVESKCCKNRKCITLTSRLPSCVLILMFWTYVLKIQLTLEMTKRTIV